MSNYRFRIGKAEPSHSARPRIAGLRPGRFVVIWSHRRFSSRKPNRSVADLRYIISLYSNQIVTGYLTGIISCAFSYLFCTEVVAPPGKADQNILQWWGKAETNRQTQNAENSLRSSTQAKKPRP